MWTVPTAIKPPRVYHDNDDSAYLIRNGRGCDEPDTITAEPAAAAGRNDFPQTVIVPQLSKQVEAACLQLPIAGGAGAAVGNNPHGLPCSQDPLHVRGRIIIEACSPISWPVESKVERNRVFRYDMRREWRIPDKAAAQCMSEGHSGETGVLMRSVAFHQCWGGVVAAARRACNRAWWRQLNEAGVFHQPLVLTFLCHNGRHLSVAAAVLLADALREVEGAAAAEVELAVGMLTCGCPQRCTHFERGGWNHYQDAEACRILAVMHTRQLMQADALLAPREALQ